MLYLSTRNSKEKFSFKDVFLNGLASDGGLYVPETIPFYSSNELENLKKLSYEELAIKIILNFCSDEFNENEIKNLVNKSYREFRNKNIVNIKKLENIILLELINKNGIIFDQTLIMIQMRKFKMKNVKH